MPDMIPKTYHMCNRYAIDVPQTCPRYATNIPQKFSGCTTGLPSTHYRHAIGKPQASHRQAIDTLCVEISQIDAIGKPQIAIDLLFVHISQIDTQQLCHRCLIDMSQTYTTDMPQVYYLQILQRYTIDRPQTCHRCKMDMPRECSSICQHTQQIYKRHATHVPQRLATYITGTCHTYARYDS